MRLIPFLRAVHLPILESMLVKRKISSSFVFFIPMNGFIALDDKNDPIGIGFVRMVEGGFGMLDSFITDPDATSESRSHAIDQLVKELLAKCAKLGIDKIFAFTREESLWKRAESIGFRNDGSQFMVFDMQKGI